jgi:GR25 family glycosyltransferase involved in LPS biosynthesis
MSIKGYYINLKEYPDRNANIEQLKIDYPFFQNLERFDAVKYTPGSIGRSVSHIHALYDILSSFDDQNVGIDDLKGYSMIIEDDFTILNSDHFSQFINSFDIIKDDLNWDIIILTPLGISEPHTQFYTDNHFKRIKQCETITGYIIRNKHLVTLASECFLKGLRKMLEGGDESLYAVDQVWKQMQETHNFIFYEKIYAGQLPGYSSVQDKIVDYNDAYLAQV